MTGEQRQTPDAVSCFTTAHCANSNAHDALSKPHIHWLGGWGISEQTMLTIVRRLLPEAVHSAYAPTQNSVTALHNALTATALPDSQNAQQHMLAGYSTGAFLLLRELAQFKPLLTTQPLLLFAPFADFRAEGGLGGRIVATRLKLLLRRLRSDPLAAVADFYQQSGITLTQPTELPYGQADLIWGIEQLAQTAVCEQMLSSLKACETAPHIRSWIGANDALLEAQTIAALFAQNTCRIVHDASHDLASLLTAANTEGALWS